jgi:hypothetical protein
MAGLLDARPAIQIYGVTGATESEEDETENEDDADAPGELEQR